MLFLHLLNVLSSYLYVSLSLNFDQFRDIVPLNYKCEFLSKSHFVLVVCVLASYTKNNCEHSEKLVVVVYYWCSPGGGHFLIRG